MMSESSLTSLGPWVDRSTPVNGDRRRRSRRNKVGFRSPRHPEHDGGGRSSKLLPRRPRSTPEVSKSPFSGEAPATDFPATSGHDTGVCYSTLRHESNAKRIGPIGGRTTELWRLKVSGDENSAVTFSRPSPSISGDRRRPRG